MSISRSFVAFAAAALVANQSMQKFSNQIANVPVSTSNGPAPKYFGRIGRTSKYKPHQGAKEKARRLRQGLCD